MASDALLNLVISLKSDQAEKGLAGLSTHVSALGTAIGTFAGGLALAGVQKLGSAVSGFLTDAIGESRDAAKGLAQTEAVIKSTGGAANVSAAQIVEYAGALSKTTLFSDDAIQANENLLLTFTNIKNGVGEGNDIFNQANKISLDLAQAMGTDAAGGAIQLGKALNDPTKGISALTRVGVTFTKEQQAQIKTMQASGDLMGAQKIILGELSKEFGGSAAAAMEADGGFHLFQQRLSDVKQTVGDALQPALRSVMGLMSGPVLDAVEGLATAFAGKLVTGVTWLTTTGIPALVSGWQTVKPAIDDVLGVLDSLWFGLTTGDWTSAGEGISNYVADLGTIFPVLQPVTDWLSDNIPVAIDAATAAFGIGRDAVLTFVQALQGDWVNSSGILPFHQAVGELGLFISGTVVPAFQTLWTWIQDNGTVLTNVAVAVGVAIVAFEAVSAVVATVSTVVAGLGAAFAILTGPIGLVALAVGALALAWSTDFLGIQTTLTAWWQGTGSGIFAQLQTWLATNIPTAIAALVAVWNGTLLPAIQTVGAFIQTNIVPAFVTLGQWLATNIPAAITALATFWTGTLQPALTTVGTFITGTLIPTLTTLATGAMTAVGTAATTLAGFWTGTLQPALNTVWSFIQTSVIPLLESLANVYFAALNLAVTAAAGLWQNVLQPALSAVGTFIGNTLSPVIQTLSDWLSNTLNPAVTTAGNTLSTVLGPAVTAVTGFFNTWYTAIGGISGAINTVIGWLDKFAARLNSLKLPDWLTPGSPTPMEWGLRGIADGAGLATDSLTRMGQVLDPLAAKAQRVVAQFNAGDAFSKLLTMPDLVTAMRSSLDSTIQEIVGFLDSGDTQGPLTKAGADAINAFIAGMSKAGGQFRAGDAFSKLLGMPDLIAKMRTSTDSAIQEILGFIDIGETSGPFTQAGADAINAFLAGMNKALVPAIREMPAWVGFAQDLGNGLKLLGDQSPGVYDLGDGLRWLGDQTKDVAAHLPTLASGIDTITTAAAAATKTTDDLYNHIKLLSGKSLDDIGFTGGKTLSDGFVAPGSALGNRTADDPSGGESISTGASAGRGFGDGWSKGIEEITPSILDATKLTFLNLTDTVITPFLTDTRETFGSMAFGWIGAASVGINSAGGGLAQSAGNVGGAAGAAFAAGITGSTPAALGALEAVRVAIEAIKSKTVTITVNTVYTESGRHNDNVGGGDPWGNRSVGNN